MNAFAGIQAIQFGKESIDDSGRRFGLYNRLLEAVCGFDSKLTRESSRRGTRASNSSKKITQGADARARVNTCRNARSLSPTYYMYYNKYHIDLFIITHTLLSNSGPLILMKFALLSFATAFARRVLPQPGGPQSKTPLGASIPTALNNSGRRIGWTIVIRSSSRVLCSAPISDHATSGMVLNPSRFEEGCMVGRAFRKSS